jgi:uncharacterized membrane protein
LLELTKSIHDPNAKNYHPAIPQHAFSRGVAMANFIRTNLPTFKKTASYYVVHITVAAMVAYAVTGNLVMAFTLSLLEPTVQAFAFFFHEKAWERWNQRKALKAQMARPARTHDRVMTA